MHQHLYTLTKCYYYNIYLFNGHLIFVPHLNGVSVVICQANSAIFLWFSVKCMDVDVVVVAFEFFKLAVSLFSVKIMMMTTGKNAPNRNQWQKCSTGNIEIKVESVPTCHPISINFQSVELNSMHLLCASDCWLKYFNCSAKQNETKTVYSHHFEVNFQLESWSSRDFDSSDYDHLQISWPQSTKNVFQNVRMLRTAWTRKHLFHQDIHHQQ